MVDQTIDTCGGMTHFYSWLISDSWGQYFKTFHPDHNDADRIKPQNWAFQNPGDVILVLQKQDTDFVIQSNPESRLNVVLCVSKLWGADQDSFDAKNQDDPDPTRFITDPVWM